MQLIADILMGLGAFGASIYCMVLARRLKRFNQLESGMGGAIAVLSAQVDDMTKALNRAQATASASAEQLRSLTERAEQGAQRLELILAAMQEAQGRASEPAPIHEPEPEPQRHRVLRRRVRPASLEAAE
ncbi:hypothetical protein C8J30_102311 [Rhodobacter viridis]|uniref:Uncharacterized protein n=1 Tax=Rhodobacter viridis TaxID=1054202 RepID=A0A318U6I4_9RHOB|nr:hypothetical protein [Rhodobacter viridis]PYF11996.1 hypothetical protein C8J30_102311 [Rhodobacter viridis]